MSNVAKDAAEKTFQQNFVNRLKRWKWEAPDFLDGNKQKVTVQDLINHWRQELNRINADQLEGVALTDNEFQQVMAKVSQINNSYEAAKLLAIEESTGKIDGIFRDENPKVTRQQITLTIFKKAQVSGGDSSYRIAREVSTEKGNRFDLVMLINGLPLINVELKRTDQTLDEAFGQFMRYYRDGEYCNNFMAFSQMMVMSTEIETRYFATPKSIDGFNPAFVFHWADKNNKPVNQWESVIDQFLMIPMAHQMVGDYLIIDEARDAENRRHMLMRPYQVYALQAIEGAAFGWDNEKKEPHGGFVWHTTGSGKTITSFKTAMFLSTRAGFDKVVFLVDRRELDKRTSENFIAYATYEAVEVDDTKATYQLRKHLKSAKTGIVVTTTFKLDALVKELVEAHDNSLADKKMVFIVDEAHRTTMGHMMGRIQRYFKKNGLFYGFTGTPLFEENEVKGMVNEKSELINTTEKLFGPKLHQYTIDEAIADGNVLGFHVDYINTGEFKSYDDLRDQLIELIAQEKPERSQRDIEREVQGWSELEVEKQAVENGLLVYQDETHIPRVVAEILDNWESQSQHGQFNAILTVAYKNRVIAYYNEFKKQIAERSSKPNVAMTFSFDNENDPETVPKEIMEMMFRDYAAFTGIEFIAGDKKHGEDAYFEDLIDRAARGGSGRNPKNIDIVIVADQLLTGYDSKFLNTLYVDRSLELQRLIQAYSRTNRVFGKTKEFGIIVNFQYPRITEEIVNTALKLYGSGGKSSLVIVDLYETAVEKLHQQVEALLPTLPDPTAWVVLKDDEDAKNMFKSAYLDAVKQLNLVEQYYEYQWDDIAFGLTEHCWLRYKGAYKNLFPPNGSEDVPGEIKPLVARTKLTGVQVIDAAHILKLIGEKVRSAGDRQIVDDETLRIIHEQIQELSNLGDDGQARLLKEFVDTELVSGHISSHLGFDEAFEAWKQEKQKLQIISYAENWGINADILEESMAAYSVTEPDNIPRIEEITASVDFGKAKNKAVEDQLELIMALTETLPIWMKEMKQKYR